MSNVQLGYIQVIDPISFKSIPSGKIYIGEYGTLPNPANAGTWKQAYFVNSDGTRTAASQPIATNAAGYAVDGSGNIKSVQVDGKHSILVQSSLGSTKFSNPKVSSVAYADDIDLGVGRTQADKNAETISVTDFGANPSNSSTDNDAAFLAAYAFAGDVPVYVPDGEWPLTNPNMLPADFFLYGPGVIVFDKAEVIRALSPAAGGIDYFTVFYLFNSQLDVECTLDGSPYAISGWQTDNTFYVATPVSGTHDFRYWVNGGKLSLGDTPYSVRVFSSFQGGVPINYAPTTGTPNPWSMVGGDNYSASALNLARLTTGGGNTVVGPRAGHSLTTGSNNTFSGYQSGWRTTTSSGNTAYGCIALEHNTTGSENTSVGFNSLGNNKTGNGNTSVGFNSQNIFAEASYNTSIGYRALGNGGTLGASQDENVAVGAFACDFVAGKSNIGIGYRALNAEGASGLQGEGNIAIGTSSFRKLVGVKNYNTTVGFLSLTNETSGSELTSYGAYSLNLSNGGSRNSAFGFSALSSLVTANDCAAFGWSALKLSTGSTNSAFGARSQESTTTGSNNTSLGFESGRNINAGSANTLIGTRAGREVGATNDNTAVGSDALQFLTSGNTNTAIGRSALRVMQDTTNATTLSNATGIGAGSRVSGNNQVQIGDSATTTYVYGTVQNRSDLRDKADVRDTVLGLDFIKSLRPVDYKWDMREDYSYVDQETGEVTILPKDGSKKRIRYHHGLIAQDVKYLCEQTGVDFGGLQDHTVNGGCDVLSIGYDELIAPLIKALQEVSARQDSIEQRLNALEIK